MKRCLHAIISFLSFLVRFVISTFSNHMNRLFCPRGTSLICCVFRHARLIWLRGIRMSSGRSLAPSSSSAHTARPPTSVPRPRGNVRAPYSLAVRRPLLRCSCPPGLNRASNLWVCGRAPATPSMQQAPWATEPLPPPCQHHARVARGQQDKRGTTNKVALLERTTGNQEAIKLHQSNVTQIRYCSRCRIAFQLDVAKISWIKVGVLLLLFCACSRGIELSSSLVTPMDLVQHAANRREEQGAVAPHHHY
jgi:hypothetical protein